MATRLSRRAALGLAQLEQLEEFIAVKRRNYQLYKDLSADVRGIRLLDIRGDIRSNHWFYALYVEDSYALNRDEMIQHLHRHRIQSRPIWGLIHEQKPYEGAYAYRIEKAKDYWQHIVNLPCSTDLVEEDVRRVVNRVKV